MKYGIWNVSNPEMGAVNALVTGGYSPLTAMVLSSRGITNPEDANAFLSCDCPMPDPYRMKDMDKAVARIGLAMARGEKIAVFEVNDSFIEISENDMPNGFINKLTYGIIIEADLVENKLANPVLLIEDTESKMQTNRARLNRLRNRNK